MIVDLQEQPPRSVRFLTRRPPHDRSLIHSGRLRRLFVEIWMPTYSELLKHPKWQRKRLKILEQRRFACEDCGAVDKTLHVHHGYYARGNKPWEYPDESLHSLCADCHLRAQDAMELLHRSIALLDGGSQEVVLGCVRALLVYFEAQRGGDATIEIDSCEVAEGVGMVFGLDESQVLKSARNGSTTVRRLRGFDD